jgi:hypothetical protein
MHPDIATLLMLFRTASLWLAHEREPEEHDAPTADDGDQ